jgi:hypothetical protein
MSGNTLLAKLTLSAMLAAPIASFAVEPAHLWGELPDMPSVKTRAEVKQELQAFRANPVAADGYRWSGGSMGWVPPDYPYTTDRRTAVAHATPHDDQTPNLQGSAPEPARANGMDSSGG